MFKKSIFIFLSFFFFTSLSLAQNPLDKWKPAFDPSGAKYKCIVSNVGHPAMKGSYAGFLMRDELWKKTNGQIYLDFKPLGVLGGEVEVLNMLQMGAIQGMAVSSVAATNLGPRFGLINLPYLINDFQRLEKFTNSGKLYEHFLSSMEHQGILGFDITGYGTYGWATTSPVANLEEAKKIKFRIAESSVNRLLYKEWGLNATVMPWADVIVGLKQGVVTGVDHVPITCSIQRIFEVPKYYTRTNHAQGLFIWIFNKKWFEELPPDLQKIFKETVQEVAAKIRQETEKQELDEIEKSKTADKVTYYDLSQKDMEFLKKQGINVYEKYRDEINKINSTDKYKFDNYLKDVQDYMK